MAQRAHGPMVGGDGKYSYANNSTLQGLVLIVAKNLIKEGFTENLDLKKLLSGSTTCTIADFGCSVGENTLLAAQTLVDTVNDKASGQPKLEFQVFFNDQTGNDFNTLFASLDNDDRRNKYFAAGVPGSFHGRLFPRSSIHVAYSCCSIHWLSRVPDELLDRESPAWNGGRIHYDAGAPEAVVRAYENQFDKDMEKFLEARAQEIVAGGIMVILVAGVYEGALTHAVGICLTFLGSILMDMVKEGILKQDEVESINIPHVYPCVNKMERVVERNGSFEIAKLELIRKNGRVNPEGEVMDIEAMILNLRAAAESTLAIHLGGDEIIDEVFARAFHHKTRLHNMLYSRGDQNEISNAVLCAILKRK